MVWPGVVSRQIWGAAVIVARDQPCTEGEVGWLTHCREGLMSEFRLFVCSTVFAGWQFSISCSEQCGILGNDVWPSVGRMVPLLTYCCHASLPAWYITYQSTQLSCESNYLVLICPLWLLHNCLQTFFYFEIQTYICMCFVRWVLLAKQCHA